MSRGAVPCPAVPCPCPARALPCGAVLCHARPCCVFFSALFLYAKHYSNCHTTGTTAVRPRHYIVESPQKCSHSSAQPSYSSSAQHRAVTYLRNGPAFFLRFFCSRFFLVALKSLMSYQRSQLSLAWRIIISSAPLSRAHRSASSAAQRRVVPRGAVPCRAVRDCAALCHAVPCCVLFAALFLHAKYHSKCRTTRNTAVRTS